MIIQGLRPFESKRNPSSEIISRALAFLSIYFLTVNTSSGFEQVAEMIAEPIELNVTQLYSYYSNFPHFLKFLIISS